MKNVIIAILALACGYFLLHALGAFNFGSFIDREYRTHHESIRDEAVNAAPEYILGTVYDDENWAAAEAVRGVALAVDIVNARHPTKPYKLITRGDGHEIPLNNAAVQTLASASDTAALIGPFESIHTPSTRALTQFQGLPLLSPTAVISEKLPRLEPDNFVTLFPPLQLWVGAILDHMESNNIKNVFILCPGAGTYGDIFCTALERDSRSRRVFNYISRINYQSPLRRQDMERLIRSHTGAQKFDAIFFGGVIQDFPELLFILEDNHIALPVYGSDDLYAPDAKESRRKFDLFLPRVSWKNESQEFKALWRQRYGNEPYYHANLGAETVFLLDKILTTEKGYHAENIPSLLRKYIKDQSSNPGTAPMIIVDKFTEDKPEIEQE